MNKAILGHGLWQRRYGGAPDALGRMIRLPMGEFEVVGVMPAGYGYPDRATLWAHDGELVRAGAGHLSREAA